LPEDQNQKDTYKVAYGTRKSVRFALCNKYTISGNIRQIDRYWYCETSTMKVVLSKELPISKRDLWLKYKEKCGDFSEQKN
jgi:hypothetical protein